MPTRTSVRNLFFLTLCLGLAACGGRKAPARAKNDPNTPAVISLPGPVLASDTAKPDTAVKNAAFRDVVRHTLAVNYAVLSAAIGFGDSHMIASQFDSAATFSTPDTTYRGREIAIVLARMGPTMSLKSFDRLPKVTRVADSVVVDSGAYALFSKRPGADSAVERGAYVTRWRIHAAPLDWLIVSDRLYPAKGSKRPKR